MKNLFAYLVAIVIGVGSFFGTPQSALSNYYVLCNISCNLGFWFDSVDKELVLGVSSITCGSGNNSTNCMSHSVSIAVYAKGAFGNCNPVGALKFSQCWNVNLDCNSTNETQYIADIDGEGLVSGTSYCAVVTVWTQPCNTADPGPLCVDIIGFTYP